MADLRAMGEKEKWSTLMSQLVRERRTIRSFSEHPLSQEIVMERLQAAGQSVFNEKGKLPCRFVYIASREGKEKAVSLIMSVYAEHKLYKWLPSKVGQMMAERIISIPAFLVVVQEMEESEEMCERDYASICAMLQSFSLLAWDCGIGLVWNTEPYMRNQSFATDMGLQQGERIVTILFMGNYERIPKGKQRTPVMKKISFL
ncbi:nitroreductase family protein [Brevibacillus sp. SIMBA_040]|uniref:nitroreductase family protein n=1 Tax=unclassified Brevibacillus TaxID=2684853 RepID=UPI00397E4749